MITCFLLNRSMAATEQQHMAASMYSANACHMLDLPSAIRPIHTSNLLCSALSKIPFHLSQDLGTRRSYIRMPEPTGHSLPRRLLCYVSAAINGAYTSYIDSPYLFPIGLFDPENWKVGRNCRRVMHCSMFIVDIKSAKFTCIIFFTSRPTTELQVQVQVPSQAVHFSQPGAKVVTKRAIWPFGSSF